MAIVQRVDPFIPIKNQRPAPQGQYGARWLRKPDAAAPQVPSITPTPAPAKIPALHTAPKRSALPPSSRARSVDGIMPWHLKQQPSTAPKPELRGTNFDIMPAQLRPRRPIEPHFNTAEPILPPVKNQPAPAQTEEAPATKNRQLLPKAQLVALILGAIGAGLSIQFLPLGELVIGVYAIYAIARRIPSRTSFLLALIALVGIVVLLATRGMDPLSQNFAVYTFLLLAVGTISLGFELRRQQA